MKRILFALAITLIASSLLAQQHGPNPKLADLKYFAGHWSCTGTALAFMGNPEHKTTATIDGAWNLNDYWFQLHYKEPKTAANATPVEVIYFWGWDEQTKKFASIAADNGGGHFAQTSPGWESDKVTFEGDMHIAGTTMRFHDVFTKLGPAKLMHKGEALMNGKWTKLDEETCTR